MFLNYRKYEGMDKSSRNSTVKKLHVDFKPFAAPMVLVVYGGDRRWYKLEAFLKSFEF